jgi:hypothetical protein
MVISMEKTPTRSVTLLPYSAGRPLPPAREDKPGPEPVDGPPKSPVSSRLKGKLVAF